MGLDQQLFRTTKKRKEATEKFNELSKQYRSCLRELEKQDRWQNLWDSLPLTEDKMRYDVARFTDEQKKEIECLKETAKHIAEGFGIHIDEATMPDFEPSDFGLTNDDVNVELAYFDRDWDLHNFIIDNFGDKENDNLVEVWLDRDAVDKIIDAGFYVDVFTQARTMIDDNHVLYYYPWY